MDSISLLGQAGGPGDDLLGISYDSAGARIRAWGKQGAFWGAIFGLLAGACGLFVVPSLGALIAVGPIVDVIAGAITGAAVFGGALAGAAAISQLAVALHRMGIPENRLQHFHDAIAQGGYVILVKCGSPSEAQRWQSLLAWSQAHKLEIFPYLP